MISIVLSMYRPKYVSTIVYMLQSTEYQPIAYLKWYWRTNNFSGVTYRRTLDKTKAARLLIFALSIGIGLQICAGLALIVGGLRGSVQEGQLFGLAVIIAYPVVWAHLVVVPMVLGRLIIINPRNNRLIAKSKQIFYSHPATKIAIAGSYGKTSMKELLNVVLSEGKKVAATPGNKNVSSSHAVFADGLEGNEEVLIIEYGEGEPGDVTRFCEITKPNIGVITGIAPAHLDKYPTLEAAARDIFSLVRYLKDNDVYVNRESALAKPFIKKSHHNYSRNGVDGLTVKSMKLSIEGTEFEVVQGKKKLKFHTKLLGKHNIGPLVTAIAIAKKLGLSDKVIQAGIAKTEPYEHRMQPCKLGGAWIIDDTYNGNIEGIRVGLELLSELSAKRKIYVTPGLVDQGVETESVHKEMGRLIAKANPDKVVLMNNSATKIIAKSLSETGFKNELVVQDDPLAFYQNLEHFVAAGDIVLMQNDWTDNYN